MRFADLPNRREFLKWAGLTVGAAALPLGCGGDEAVQTGFFSDGERRALAALADGILPPDDTPGGSALGAVNYIERLLTAFERAPTFLFTGGPYSGRNPLPNPDGTPSTMFPPNDFATPAPLDRYTEAAWRLHLYGSDGVAGGGPNDAALGKVEGLRDTLRNTLAQAAVLAKKPVEQLDAAGIQTILNRIDADRLDTLVQLVSQAAFGSPEYGGNPNGAGWKMVHFEGDVQPLGYSWFDTTTNQYRERPDAPVSTPNPYPDPEPLDPDVTAYVDQMISLIGGKKLP
jgi:hypothetical protein